MTGRTLSRQPRLELPADQCFINGSYRQTAGGESFTVYEPATGEPLAQVARGRDKDIECAVEAARAAQPGWAAVPPGARAACLRRLAAIVEAHAQLLTDIEVADAGKPRQLAAQEIMGCAEYLMYYAGAVDKLQGDTIPLGNGYLDFTLHEPVGVTAHIVPWNAPLNMLCRSLAPALAAGNTVVAKPAEQTPLSTLKLAELFGDSELEPGVFNVVPGLGHEAGDALARHPDIGSITFTGSVATGRHVLRCAADQVKPVVVELGGKAPQVVLPDADLDQAAEEVTKGAFANSGQYCDAGARLLVHASIAETLVEKIVARARALTVGPGDTGPDLGPLVSKQHFDTVCDYVSVALAQGAECVLGGAPLPGTGYFVPPTILTHVQPQMRVFREEIFGPVLTVTEFDDLEQALALANDCDYGLAAGIYTHDIDRAMWLAHRIEAGYVMINEYFAGGVNVPFGGCKHSGYSRERGQAALGNYLRTKNVVLRWRVPSG